jgi:hypothetical protein
MKLILKIWGVNLIVTEWLDPEIAKERAKKWREVYPTGNIVSIKKPFEHG